MVKDKTIKKRVVNHLGRVSLALISVALMARPVTAAEPVQVIGEAIGNEGG